MKLTDPQLIERLAERYVLGTMRGPARQRFAAYTRANFAVRDAVQAWETRLTPLAWSLPPVAPSELTWRRIRAALQFDRPASATHRPWAAIAAALALLAIINGGGWWQAAQKPPVTITETETVIQRVPETVSVALLNDEAGNPLWLLSLRPQSAKLALQVITEPEAQPDRDYQLWLLTADGTPLSLGLLPLQGERSLTLPAGAITALPGSRMVAVSLEPAGGSPEPVPTGPVLFTAMLLQP